MEDDGAPRPGDVAGWGQLATATDYSMRLLLMLLSVAATTTGSLSAQSSGIALTYLANMGVLLEGGGKRVVIDGFHRGGLAEYAAVPQEMLVPLEQARAPFATLDLVFTTHRHPDHFDAASVAARLGADSVVLYIAAQETVDTLHARTTLPPGFSRARGVVPPNHGEQRLRVSGIDVSVLDLPHNPTSGRRVANVGLLLELDGVRVLHVGDADPTATNFDVHRLAARRVDVAIVPFWYLTGTDDTVRRAIAARLWIATHIPPSDTAAVRRQVLDRWPGAIVLTTPGERHSLR